MPSCLVLALHHTHSRSKGHPGLCALPTWETPNLANIGLIQGRLIFETVTHPSPVLCKHDLLSHRRVATCNLLGIRPFHHQVQHRHPFIKYQEEQVEGAGPNPKTSFSQQTVLEDLRVPEAFAVQGYLHVAVMRSGLSPQGPTLDLQSLEASPKHESRLATPHLLHVKAHQMSSSNNRTEATDSKFRGRYTSLFDRTS